MKTLNLLELNKIKVNHIQANMANFLSKGGGRGAPGPGPEPDIVDALLLETSGAILLEDGNYFQLEEPFILVL